MIFFYVNEAYFCSKLIQNYLALYTEKNETQDFIQNAALLEKQGWDSSHLGWGVCIHQGCIDWMHPSIQEDSVSSASEMTDVSV